jgi:hypothetical protein
LQASEKGRQEKPAMTIARKLQIALAALLVLFITGGGAFAAGRGQGRIQGAEPLAGVNAALSACELDRANRGAALDERHDHILTLEARRRIARAGEELDARNFGHAETELRAAADALSQTVDSHPEVGDLLARLSAANVSVAADLDQQRSAIRAFAAELDGFIEGGGGAAGR